MFFPSEVDVKNDNDFTDVADDYLNSCHCLRNNVLILEGECRHSSL